MTRLGVFSMQEAEYRAADAIANSDLKYMQRSPAHFFAARLDPEREPEVETAVKIAGRALHCAILEPHTFGERFVFTPEDAPKDLRHHRNAAKPSPDTLKSVAWWDAFEANLNGRTMIDRTTTAKVQKAGASIRAHPELSAYLREGTAEESIFAIDPETGLACKIRTDWRCQIAGQRIIIDLKSTDDARPEKFKNTAYNFGYFQGAAWYCDVHEWAGLGHVDLYLLVAFERDAPHGVKIYEVGEYELEKGRAEYRKSLALYKHCKEVGEWPSYSTDIEPLTYPAWAK